MKGAVAERIAKVAGRLRKLDPSASAWAVRCASEFAVTGTCSARGGRLPPIARSLADLARRAATDESAPPPRRSEPRTTTMLASAPRFGVGGLAAALVIAPAHPELEHDDEDDEGKPDTEDPMSDEHDEQSKTKPKRPTKPATPMLPESELETKMGILSVAVRTTADYTAMNEAAAKRGRGMP